MLNGIQRSYEVGFFSFQKLLQREIKSSMRIILLSIPVLLFWRKKKVIWGKYKAWKKVVILGMSVGSFVSSDQVQLLSLKLFYKTICFVGADFKNYWT